MNQRLQKYIGKFIKVHLAPEWSFQGRLQEVLNDGTCLLTTESAEIVINTADIRAVTHVPANERGPMQSTTQRQSAGYPPQSTYHPVADPRNPRYDYNNYRT